jgi:hypothetical protein
VVISVFRQPQRTASVSSGIVLSHEQIKARRGFTAPARRRSASHAWTPENDMAGDPGTRLSDLAAAIPPDCRIAQGCSARAGGCSDPDCGKPAILRRISHNRAAPAPPKWSGSNDGKFWELPGRGAFKCSSL